MLKSLRTTGFVLLGMALLGACSGDSDNDSLTMAEAFCNDLEAGYTPFSILMPLIRDGMFDPETAADRAYAWTARECPKQFETNEVLMYYLGNWGIDPTL